MKKEIDELKNAKTFKECAKIIYGINYTNGKIQKSVIDYCFENYSINIVSIMNNNKKNYCLNCGKEIKNGKKFCNSSCAAKYNNKNRKLTEETKKKISNSLKRPKKKKKYNTNAFAYNVEILFYRKNKMQNIVLQNVVILQAKLKKK